MITRSPYCIEKLTGIYQDYQFELWMIGCATKDIFFDTVIGDDIHHLKPTLEKWLLSKSDLLLACYYIWFSDKRNWTEAESKIANSKYALWYAIHRIEGRWPPGEKAIASDARDALEYINNFIKAPWPMAEDNISANPYFAYLYARTIIKGAWPKGEPAIASEPQWAYWYAKDVIKGPWPFGEASIKEDAHWRGLYESTIGFSSDE